MAEEPDDAMALLMEMTRATDAALRRQVLALVPRLLLERARRGPRGRPGAGRRVRTRADLGGDLDLEASLDPLLAARAERRPVSVEELVATDWDRPATALCLVLDRSGSMDGPRLAGAAFATAACAIRAETTGQELAVVAFDRRAEVVVDRAHPIGAQAGVARVLGLRGHGMTSLDAGLRAAARQLDGTRARRRICVLLSDCRVTDDVDPLPAARSLAELVVIAPAGDDEEARRFAGSAGARVETLDAVSRLPELLDRLLG